MYLVILASYAVFGHYLVNAAMDSMYGLLFLTM